jgi:hypothetical protein
MKKRIRHLISFCSKLDFGAVNLSREEEIFRGKLNLEILLICQYLPQSMRTKAALFLMQYLHAVTKDSLNFVNYFYAPAWSILYWLPQADSGNKKLSSKYLKDAKTGHTMAMFLHAFDDHLADGQLPVSHMALLIRSQAWMLMNRAFERLARGVEKGGAIVSAFINDYYSSIDTSAQMKSLDSYCDFFRKQMATWLIIPLLLAKKISTNEEFVRSIESSYVSFGIAWRLLDDIQDLEKDLKKGVCSSLYACLPNKLRKVWNQVKEEKASTKRGSTEQVIDYILKKGVVNIIRQRICHELESASSNAEKFDLSGFAEELRCLLKPLKYRYNRS